MGFFRDICRQSPERAASEAAPSVESVASVEISEAPTLREGGYPAWLMLPGRAMNISTVFRCVRLLSDTVASLPVMYLRRRGGIFVEAPDTRLHYLLTVQPDYATSAFDFWKRAMEQVLVHGNAYIVPVYNKASLDYDRLVLCDNYTVTYDPENDIYDISDQRNAVYGRYTENEVIHLKGITLNDSKVGMSVLSYARLTTGIAEAGARETLSRFRSGGNVRGFVLGGKSVKGFGGVQDSELDRQAEVLEDDIDNSKRIHALPGALDFKQLSLSSTDLQFLESRKFTVMEICGFFGIHPSFITGESGGNYKSVEQANMAFMTQTLNPLLRMIESEFQRKLFGPSRSGRNRIQFDRRSLYACDIASKVRYQAQAIQSGLYTVNELRREENRPEVPGGDTVLVSANLRNIAGEPSGDTTEPAGEPKADTDGKSNDTTD